ncbi:hypothetical protein PEPS_40210 (plasmid) [Persicobacter psychrovividus]|uniref:Uncharacterized protein n=2 Tax=Persicobacter psychrovividus TaxID=387638 RepID=A0ABM7VL79_9BACT|nr:hypothetical protein PEPS_40210 [Persicobacter psychrovividus]
MHLKAHSAKLDRKSNKKKMTEKKLNQVAEQEVRQLRRFIKEGHVPKESVTMELFVETVSEDRNVPREQAAKLEERLAFWMKEIGFEL